MLRLRKICCCFSSEPDNVEATEHDAKSPSTNDTIIASGKKPVSQKKEEVPVLTLVVVESMHLSLNSEFIILPTGLKDSNRKAKDNCVYAGTLEQQGSMMVNDIVLPSDEKGAGKRHFMIKFNKGKPHLEQQKYCLKDMGEGLGTFVRIDQPLRLKTSYIISFGDSHMIVSLDNTLLTLRFIQGPKTDQKSYKIYRTYSPEDSPIKIGRMSDCDIRFDDNSLSRYHFFMYYDDQWIIQDGDGKKLSTNGTWMFAEQFFEVYNDMVFKAGETLFKTKLSVGSFN